MSLVGLCERYYANARQEFSDEIQKAQKFNMPTKYVRGGAKTHLTAEFFLVFPYTDVIYQRHTILWAEAQITERQRHGATG